MARPMRLRQPPRSTGAHFFAPREGTQLGDDVVRVPPAARRAGQSPGNERSPAADLAASAGWLALDIDLGQDFKIQGSGYRHAPSRHAGTSAAIRRSAPGGTVSNQRRHTAPTASG
jgi:hypothetical protein